MREPSGVVVRALRKADLPEVLRIDAVHTGSSKVDYWTDVFVRFLGGGEGRIGLAAESGEGLAGYLLAEVRAFEFGSEACGWIFAVGVDPSFARAGVASKLLAEVCRKFGETGIDRVRTMVRRSDVPVLAFFRANGFTGGSFVQLELELDLGGG